MKFEIGDWVQGNTNAGELVHGFIETIDVFHGTVGIHVVASDHEIAIGKEIEVRGQSVKKLPITSLDNEDQIKNLIDLALSTRDELWFAELSLKLSSIQHKSNKNGKHHIVTPSNRNRLGLSGMR